MASLILSVTFRPPCRCGLRGRRQKLSGNFVVLGGMKITAAFMMELLQSLPFVKAPPARTKAKQQEEPE